MRENDGRKLDHKTLEALRLRAVDQVCQGARPEDVAVALGLHRKTVYAWLKKYREGGRSALLAKPVPGRPPRLSERQVRDLSALLTLADPRQFNFEAALWTTDIVREVIGREFGVSLSRVSVGRQLGKLGITPRRPLHRAYQRDPDATAGWQRQVYPQIAAKAAAAGATVYFADQADVQREDGGIQQRWDTLCAVTAKGGGAPRFAVFDAGTAAALNFAEFCARLIHDSPGPVYLVVDGQPAHRANAVREYAAANRGNLELYYLPAAE